MELKTEIKPCPHPFDMFLCVDGTRTDVERDAAAAHAYKQALREWRDLPTHAHPEQWSVEWIEGRANAILGAWLFQERARS